MKSPTTSRMQLRRISANGFGSYPGIPRRAVSEGQVEIAMEYLQRFSEAKKLTRFAPNSYALKHAAERWSGKYISNGAMLIAAIRLGFQIRRYLGTPNAQIGILKGDVERLSVPRLQAQVIGFRRRN